MRRGCSVLLEDLERGAQKNLPSFCAIVCFSMSPLCYPYFRAFQASMGATLTITIQKRHAQFCSHLPDAFLTRHCKFLLLPILSPSSNFRMYVFISMLLKNGTTYTTLMTNFWNSDFLYSLKIHRVLFFDPDWFFCCFERRFHLRWGFICKSEDHMKWHRLGKAQVPYELCSC